MIVGFDDSASLMTSTQATAAPEGVLTQMLITRSARLDTACVSASPGAHSTGAPTHAPSQCLCSNGLTAAIQFCTLCYVCDSAVSIAAAPAR